MTAAPGLKYSDLTDKIIHEFYGVYNDLGHGYLESVYRNAFKVALAEAGLKVEEEVPIAVWYRGRNVGDFRADLVVNGPILIELKTAQCITKAHEAQTMHYLRSTALEVALLFNFGPKPGFRRLILTNDQKEIRENPCQSVVGG